MRRFVSTSAVGTAALLALVATLQPAAAADPTYPTGVYRIEDPVVYLTDPAGELDPRAHTVVREVSVTDDITPSGSIGREIDADDGDGFESWGDGGFLVRSLHYTVAGEYHPRIRLTDGDGHQTLIALPTITVARDLEPPFVTIDPPRRSLRHRVAGWRDLHGLAIDQQSGLYLFGVTAVLRRGGRWYIYSFEKGAWFKTRASTTRAQIIDKTRWTKWWSRREPVNGHWTAPRLKGLKPGVLIVVVYADDQAPNGGRTLREVRLTKP